MDIVRISQQLVPSMSEMLHPLLARGAAETYGWWTVRELLELACKPESATFAAFDGPQIVGLSICKIAEVYDAVHLRCVGIIIAGDDWPAWGPEMQRQTEEWARFNGCKTMEFGGRLGWKKFAEQEGFKQLSAIYGKEL